MREDGFLSEGLVDVPGHDVVPEEGGLKRKLLSLSHGQELGKCAELASEWLFMLVQLIRSQVLLVDTTVDHDYNL